MRRMRARWVVGAPLALGAMVLSCGSGGADNLFSDPAAMSGTSAGGASSHAGAPHVGGGAAGATNPSRGTSGNGAGGAAHGGAMNQAGAPNPGGGAPNPGAGASNGGAANGGSNQAGAGGAHAGAGGAPANGGGGAGGSVGGAGAGGGSAGGGGAGGATCVDNGACANTEYCAKSSCAEKAEGHCTPSPTECGNAKSGVVCGCDGVTYHDACLLHQARQNSSALDACPKAVGSTVTCTTADSAKCSSLDGVCGFKVENACLNTGTTVVGICWVLPASCPGSDSNTAEVCGADGVTLNCATECAAIKSAQRYSVSGVCK